MNTGTPSGLDNLVMRASILFANKHSRRSVLAKGTIIAAAVATGAIAPLVTSSQPARAGRGGSCYGGSIGWCWWECGCDASGLACQECDCCDCSQWVENGGYCGNCAPMGSMLYSCGPLTC
jgi:hypothetical protein